ncbi:MAG: MOSC domain-containing protein, partial [Actinobacteria bacterium]|nr:MOSC domain-containing protein [Actinomycetota bacterium]
VGDTDERWPELSWVGRRFSIGTAEIEVLAGCPRCVMVTRPVAELAEDRSVLRTIVREASQDLGVYATVITPGTVSLGDTLTPID